MKKGIAAAFLIMAIATTAVAGLQLGQYQNQTPTKSDRATQPLVFVQNIGQWDSRVLYRAESGGAVFFFGNDEVNFMFIRNTDRIQETPISGMQSPFDKFNYPAYQQETIMIKARFIGASDMIAVEGSKRLVQQNNYFIRDNRDKWRKHVPCYSSITYNEIYPGIDLHYYGNGNSLKYDFIVSPGADISRIQIQYEGIDGLCITNDGSLSAMSSFGPVYELTPYIYQEKNGQKKEIVGRYIIKAPGEFGFAVNGNYDPDLPLVIDPELVFATYLGGSGSDMPYGIAVDETGSIYITGCTLSSDFPIVNPYQPDINQSWDVFVTKLSADGGTIIFSTYIGGSLSEQTRDIALDNDGNAYITGFTASSDYPAINAFQNSCFFDFDAFVTKLSSNGDSLIYSTYLGGERQDVGNSIAVDRLGSAYVAGVTSSISFPLKNPLFCNRPNEDVFITKLSSGGDSLVYSTYLGGENPDLAYGIAVDKEYQVYVAGYTGSRDFPMLYSHQSYAGVVDAFITKLNPGGTALRYSTLIGGSGADYTQNLAIDYDGCAYITGYTDSPDYPAENPFQTNREFVDIFLTKISPTRCNIVYSTYLGGNSDDWGFGIAVDRTGGACVMGMTNSSDFPSHDYFQTDAWGLDAFIARFDPSGNAITFGTYYGGNNCDYGLAGVLDNNDNIYLTGLTWSTDLPVLNAVQSYSGEDDIFAAKFALTSAIEQNETPIPQSSILGNYPNPFNSSTLIRYQVETKAKVSAAIYNILGERVAELCDEYQEPGSHSLTWDASMASSGIYLCRLEIGGKAEYSKMTLVK